MATKKTKRQINEAHHDKDHDMKKKKEMEKEEKKSAKKESTDKFQQMLEYLVNEDKEKAEELFHEIVVEKSRQIYEDLLAEELAEDEIEEADEEEVEESDEDEIEEADEEEVEESDEDEEVAEEFDLDEFDVEEGPMGGDPADDMEMDMDADDDDMDMDADDDDMDMDADGDEPATQDDIKDLEAELADLKAEFEELMADKDMDDDMDKESVDEYEDYEDSDVEESDDEEVEESDDEEVEESDDEEVEESSPLSVAEQMREYVEKVTAKMGDAGAGEKSPVAGPNDMGGTSANIAQGGDESGMTPAKPKEDDMGNVNVPGAKASKSMKAMPKGHGAEKKGAPEGAADKKSMIGS